MYKEKFGVFLCCPYRGMGFHYFKLLFSQAARLKKYGVRYANFAHIMHWTRKIYCFNLLFVEFKVSCNELRIEAYPFDVLACIRIPVFGSKRKSVNSLGIAVFNLFKCLFEFRPFVNKLSFQ